MRGISYNMVELLEGSCGFDQDRSKGCTIDRPIC